MDEVLGEAKAVPQEAPQPAASLVEPTPAPQPVAPPVELAPVAASPVAVPLVEPPAPQPPMPVAELLSAAPPLEIPVSSDLEEPAVSVPRRLPSRREMRLRNELEAGHAAPIPSSSEGEAEIGSARDSQREIGAVMPSAPTPAVATPAVATPAAATPAAPPAAAKSSAVPDSATPTAFDWLPGGSTGGFASAPATPPAAVPAPTTAVVSTRPSKKTPSAHATPFPPAQDSPSGFPPLGTPAQPTPVSSAGVIDVSGGKPAAADAWARGTKVSSGKPASADTWARETRGPAAQVAEPRSTATRMATVSSWFIALMPLFAGILAVSVVKGQENYPRYIPKFIEWWMLVGGVIVVLYLVTLLLAVFDRRKLDWAGYNQPAHWAWALLSAPVYLLVRTLAVKRETGRNSILLVVWLVLAAALVGAWFVVDAFVPELIAGYTLPFL